MYENETHQTSATRLEPAGFSPRVEVASCYLEFAGELLLVKRSASKSEGNLWGVPGGKLEQGESPLQTVIREIREEVGLSLEGEKVLSLGSLYIRKPGVDYVYHMFFYNCDQLPKIKLNDEHQEYRWTTIEQALDMPLVACGVETLHHLKALAKKRPPPRKNFYFIRHGETDVNASSQIKRVDYDLPLNANGKEQALKAREIVLNIPFKSICFSPIQRAVETKNILTCGLEAEQFELNDLSECPAKIWEKMVKLGESTGYHVCDAVDSFLERVINGVNASLEKDSPTLIVSHGGVHWALCYFLQIKNHPWAIGNCELVHFKPTNDGVWEAEVIPI